MDPDEPLAAWFDDVFVQLGDDRSATLRRRLAATRVRLASLIAAAHPGADLTPDLFTGCVPMLVLQAHLPTSSAAARSHLSTVSRLVAAAHVHDAPAAPAHDAVREARLALEDRLAQRPDDPRASRIPRRLLSS